MFPGSRGDETFTNVFLAPKNPLEQVSAELPKKSQKSAPVYTPQKKFARFWGSRERKCGGLSRNLRHHFEAQKTTKKMVAKVPSETLPSSLSRPPKMAIFAQIASPAQPRIGRSEGAQKPCCRGREVAKLSPTSFLPPNNPWCKFEPKW